LEPYKGPITRSTSKQLQFLEVGESSRTEIRRTIIMGDREEINEIPENHEERNERQRIPRTRDRYSPLKLQGEQHPLPTLPQGVLLVLSGDKTLDTKRHIDQFLVMCEIHLVKHDDIMVRVLLQTLIGPTYEWYMYLPSRSI